MTPKPTTVRRREVKAWALIGNGTSHMEGQLIGTALFKYDTLMFNAFPCTITYSPSTPKRSGISKKGR